MNDYENLKKKYGERFAKLCRTLFPTILEQEGKLSEIIESHFAPSKSLFDDIAREQAVYRFKDYIYHEFNGSDEETTHVNETPAELMDRAGYVLYECKTNEDVQKFKKYYKSNEELCTFRDPKRINSHRIFFAVKKDVDKIKREDFTHPRRQDEYGTSVISIQFTRGGNSTLSIKNRYNHTVDNPDATFSNDLDNIYPGLTDSFCEHYKINLTATTSSFELDHYVMAEDGRFYKYNYEIDNVYYCENNVIIERGVAKQFDKNRYELVDYFLIDKQEKTLKILIDEEYDCFAKYHDDIEKIEITKDKNGNRTIKLIQKGNKDIYITVDKSNRMIKYENNHLIEINDAYFLDENEFLQEFIAKNLTKVGNCFMSTNEMLTSIIVPKLKFVGRNFLYYNNGLITLEMPELEYAGKCFLNDCETLKKCSFPKLREVSDSFLSANSELESIYAPNLEIVGLDFLVNNLALETLSLPKLKRAGTYFLYANKKLQELDVPELIEFGDCVLYCCSNLKKLNAPKLQIIGNDFLRRNENLDELILPMIYKIGRNCLEDNERISKLFIPNLEYMGPSFLKHNKGIKSFNAPKLLEVGYDVMPWITVFDEFYAPELVSLGYNSFATNKKIKAFYAPKLVEIGTGAFAGNRKVRKQIENNKKGKGRE